MDQAKRILIVEDDETLCKRLARLLKDKGYQVDITGSGHEALTKARTGKVDLMLLDAMLPKMDGFKVARMLKFDQKTKDIRIVMMTILNRSVDEERGKSVGVDFYLIKPFEQNQLLQSIQGLLA